MDSFGLVQDYTSTLKYYLPSTRDLFWAVLIGSVLVIAYLIWVGLPMWMWVLLTLVVSFVWNWVLLYKKAVAKKHTTLMSSSQIPAECFKEKSWWNYFSASNQKCLEYHEALMVDPILEVTPTMAVAETVTVLVLHPMEQIGHHLGKFFSAIASTQSWLTMAPVLAFSFALVFLIAIMICGYKVRLPYLMATIEPGTRPTPEPDVRKPDRVCGCPRSDLSPAKMK